MARPVAAARRYAEAAFELAQRDGMLDRWRDDLDLAADLVGRPEVSQVVDSPAVPLADRRAVLSRLLEPRLSAPAYRLVELLVVRGRVKILPRVAAEYVRLLNRHRGIVPAVVTSAAPLSAAETAAVRARIEAMAGATVELRTDVCPDLIGGLTIQVGDRLLDASVRGRLERLRDQLLSGERPR